MDPLQDPHLRIHVSTSLCLRLLYKIHIFGFMSQHLRISGSSARSTCPIHVLASTKMDPLQDPHLWIHVSASLSLMDSLQDPCLRIHVAASICISGSSARSMSPDSCLSIHMYLRILSKIHVSGSMSQHPYVSQDPLQDPCLQAHVSASLHLRILYKIHIFGFMSQHLRISGSSARSTCPIHVLASTKMDPLQDPHLWIHVSASLSLMDSLQDPCLRIHVAASICISGSSARSMSPDSCLSIHMYLRILCKIHVSGSMSQIISGASARSMSPIHVLASLSSDFVALRRRNDLRRRVLCGPAQGKQSGRDPLERFAQAKRKFWLPETRFVWPCAGKTVRPSVSRRRNANFDLPRRIFCGLAQAKRKFDLPRHVLRPYHVDSRGVTTRWTKIATALQRDAKKKNPSNRFAQAKRKFWPPESRFLWPCAGKTAEARNLHLDLRAFTLTVRTPQCATLFGEKHHEKVLETFEGHGIVEGDFFSLCHWIPSWKANQLTLLSASQQFFAVGVRLRFRVNLIPEQSEEDLAKGTKGMQPGQPYFNRFQLFFVWEYWHDRPGPDNRMTPLQTRVGLKKIAKWTSQSRRWCAFSPDGKLRVSEAFGHGTRQDCKSGVPAFFGLLHRSIINFPDDVFAKIRL